MRATVKRLRRLRGDRPRSLSYTSFADLSSELMRGSMRSSDGTRSGVKFWSQGVFAPLNRHTVSEMLGVASI